MKFLLILLLLLFILYIIYINKKMKEDANTDYSKISIPGTFFKLDNGDTGLRFPYKDYEDNKQSFILSDNYQNKEVTSKGGYKYIISELIDKKYYFMKDDISKGPFVLYKVIPITEKKESNINIDGTNGPVQVATNGGINYQSINNTSFVNNLKKYKEIMITHNILERDIDTLIANYQDEHVKESFFNKYALDLINITVNVAGAGISLLELLKG
ncbi:MAG: hypothetical protein ACK5K7_06150 [Bacilli bacterium]